LTGKGGHSFGHEDIVDRIYEASVLPELWPNVLGGISQFSATAWSTIVTASGSRARWVASSEVAEEIVRAHFDSFSDNRRTARLMSKPHAGFITDYDILTQDEIDVEPVYQEFLIPRGYGFGVGSNISSAAGDTIVIHCEGHFASGAIQPATVERLDSLRPHLARSALMSTRLAFERARTAVETLSMLGLAACAVNQSGSVLVANAEFDTETPLWTTRGGNRIAILDPRANGQLYEALGLIAAEQGVRSLPVIAPADSRPAVLHVVPIRRSAHDLFTRAAAILVLTKASDAALPASPLLRALFDLTPAEAAIAAHIATGNTVEQIAMADGKSIQTVRNQLKSVLNKTGCDRQVDLVRMLTRLALA
jgi:DNA-binding CsgD family transcriptional regulator